MIQANVSVSLKSKGRIMKHFLLIGLTSLIIVGLIHIGIVHSAPLTKSVYEDEHSFFVKRLIGDLRKAGFLLEVGKPQTLEGSSPGMFVDVIIKKYPDNLKKFFGSSGSPLFRLQLLETDSYIHFHIKSSKDGKLRDSFSYGKSIQKNLGPYFNRDDLIKEAKAALIIAVYGRECSPYNDGYGMERQLETVYFSNSTDEFINLFFKELRFFGFRFSLVESLSNIEMRFFGFPAELSGLMPDPPNPYFLISVIKNNEAKYIFYLYRSNKTFTQKNLVGSVLFDNIFDLKKRAAELAREVFDIFYVTICPQYQGT